jgi:hypothetical protein
MSIRSRAIRRTAVPVAATLAALLLIPSAALADPPAFNRDECSILLARAAIWPGGIDTESGTVRLVSDAYVSHLSAQPPCSSPED